MRFNRRPLKFAGTIEAPSDDLIRNTLGLVGASAEDAARYGGDVTRAALSAMNLRNDRKYVVVDVKVHMLMPGMSPAIPGWHTDGVPRSSDGNPRGDQAPDLQAQEEIDACARATHYHLLTTGLGCLTEFFVIPAVELTLPMGTAKLYSAMTEQVEALRERMKPRYGPTSVVIAPSCGVVEWDWWNIHRGVIATKREWRYLIRVTETDFLAPTRDLRDVIRTQQQVYAPLTFGW